MTLTTDAVHARYDEVVELVEGLTARPAADADAVALATSRVLHEARLLDGGAFETWLTWWSEDAVLWVPAGPVVHPARDQSLFLDDRRRLAERVEWRSRPSAWGQQPASATTRIIGGVEAWRRGDRVVARSGLVLHEQRRGRTQSIFGHQVHEFVGPDLMMRTKVLLVPQLEFGLRNPSFIL